MTTTQQTQQRGMKVPSGTLPRFEMKAKRFIRQKVTVPGGPGVNAPEAAD